MTDSEWFATGLPRLLETGPFLDEVRGAAAEALRDLTSPTDTAAFDLAGDLLVIGVSGLSIPDLDVSLQVLWHGGVLEGCWADDHYLWDGPLGESGELIAERVDNATWAGQRAIEWLACQLRRPIDHEVWSAARAPIAERWLFADSGTSLLHRGRRHVLATAPSSVRRVRPT